MKLLGVTRCMTCCFLCVASTATAQLSSVSVGGTIKASDINAIITALNDAAIPIGNLNLPASTPLTGNITKNGVPFLHNVGTFNTFLGCLAGNLAVSGTANTGVGDSSLIAVRACAICVAMASA